MLFCCATVRVRVSPLRPCAFSRVDAPFYPQIPPPQYIKSARRCSPSCMSSCPKYFSITTLRCAGSLSHLRFRVLGHVSIMEGLLAADDLLRVKQPRARRSSPLVVFVVVVRKIRPRCSLMQGRGPPRPSRNETLDGRRDGGTRSQ